MHLISEINNTAFKTLAYFFIGHSFYWHIHLRQIKFSLKTEPLFFLTAYAIFSLRSSLYQNMVSTNLPSLKMELKVYETFTRVASALRLDTWYLTHDTLRYDLKHEYQLMAAVTLVAALRGRLLTLVKSWFKVSHLQQLSRGEALSAVPRGFCQPKNFEILNWGGNIFCKKF